MFAGARVFPVEIRFWVVSKLALTLRRVCSAVIAAVFVSKLDIDHVPWFESEDFLGTYRVCTGTTERRHAFGPGARATNPSYYPLSFNQQILPEAE